MALARKFAKFVEVFPCEFFSALGRSTFCAFVFFNSVIPAPHGLKDALKTKNPRA